MRTTKCLCLVAALVLLVLSAHGAVEAQSLKIGVFDAQRVSEETGLGKRVQSQLSALREQKQAAIGDKEQAVAELQKQLTQQGLSLSADRRTELQKDIQRQMLDLDAARDAATRELQLELSSAQTAFQEKLQAVVAGFGKDEGFSVILDQGLVAWAADSIDVTTAIVDRFDRMFPEPAEASKAEPSK